ncbi:Protein CBG27833 [Caenorhabditis briggsae]|uniref:Protein CBG27833 n=1 Tax=Caenorhabditis briggsae TaxID=6238 RepID=B6IKB5_CAEBR|nr:Protein CBG27833 [Caenorhabditis briggsae]CAS00345.1 Protein CBG27833 [Caenorhabditis briggsae]
MHFDRSSYFFLCFSFLHSLKILITCSE